MKKYSLFILVFAIVLQGCNKDNSENNSILKSGRFYISLTSSLKSGSVLNLADSATLGSNDIVSFDLDSINASKPFAFILKNIGEQEIDAIALKADNENCRVFPSSISSLAGTSGHSSIEQGIAVDMNHGINLNGVGYTELMKMGENDFSLTISGITNNGENLDTVITRLLVKLKVFAKLSDIEIYQAESKLDLYNPYGTVINGPGGVPSMYQYTYGNASSYTIKNVGNVKIEYSVLSEDVIPTLLEKDLIMPNETKNISLPQKTGDGFVRVFLKIDANGTIVNINKKINIGQDGCGYISLIND